MKRESLFTIPPRHRLFFGGGGTLAFGMLWWKTDCPTPKGKTATLMNLWECCCSIKSPFREEGNGGRKQKPGPEEG